MAVTEAARIAARGAGFRRAQAEADPALPMLLPKRHEVLAPGLHRFVFPSESRPGVEHAVLVDLEDDGSGHLSCLCEAALFGRFCKHQRMLILGLVDSARYEEETIRERARKASSRRRGAPRAR